MHYSKCDLFKKQTIAGLPMPCIHRFGIIDCLEEYDDDEFEPEKYNCVSVDDDFLTEIYHEGFKYKLNKLETYIYPETSYVFYNLLGKEHTIMLNTPKEYKPDKKRQRIYVLLFLIIAIPLIVFCINNIIESSNQLATYDDSAKHLTVDVLNANTLIENMMYQNDFNQRSRDIMFFIFCIVALFLIVHFNFFTNTKLLLDQEGISLYLIYRKEPFMTLLWENIKSIQFGDMHTSGSKFAGYKMKIRYIEMRDNEANNTSQIIPITKFKDYNNLIKDIEQIGKKQNIDVFHMND